MELWHIVKKTIFIWINKFNDWELNFYKKVSALIPKPKTFSKFRRNYLIIKKDIRQSYKRWPIRKIKISNNFKD